MISENKVFQPKINKYQNFIDSIDESLYNGVKKGVFHLYTEDEKFENYRITLNGNRVANFGSCSYLGFDLDERIKRAAIEATIKYGVEFSSSRAYLSSGNYMELESLMGEIFTSNVQLATTTTLGHISAIPLLVAEHDAVILDQRAHASMHVATKIVQANGVHVELLPHNNMNKLEERIKYLRQKFNTIWYLIDGVYSMFGDVPDLLTLNILLDTIPQFRLYVDDAHGMSWSGKNGSGYVLSKIPLHEKMILVTGLAKGFGAGGGALVFPNKEEARKLRTCGSSLVFSGPLQPPIIGALIASAKIHLSDEIYHLQEELLELIRYANQRCKELRLPLASCSETPIIFIALGKPKVGYNLIKRLIQKGFYLDLGIFPGVPLKNTGLRITITRHHTKEIINEMLHAVWLNLPLAVFEEGENFETIYSDFGEMIPKELQNKFDSDKPSHKPSKLKIHIHSSILHLEKKLWNRFFGEENNIDWEGLLFLENSFCGNHDPENNWTFYYLHIVDEFNRTVALTVFTEIICKDDFLMAPDISARIEKGRINDPYYFSSKILCMGTMLSEGIHLYLDKSNPSWKQALKLLIEEAVNIQKTNNLSSILLRDFETNDPELSDFLMDEAFVKIAMPDTHILINVWKNTDEFYNDLSRKKRYHFNKHIQSNWNKIEVKVYTNEDILQSRIDEWYQLYKNVKDKNLVLNTYTLPKKLFYNIAKSPKWEVIEMRINEAFLVHGNKNLGGVFFCYTSEEGVYVPEIIGIDYELNAKFDCYRQLLYQAVKRTIEKKCKKMSVGMTAGIEKKKLQAKPFSRTAFIQSNDTLKYEILNSINRS